MLSGVLLAHLNELVGSINLSYQYFLKEQGIESINLEYLIESLYELTITNNIIDIKQKTLQIENITKELPETKETEIKLKHFYMKGMTHSYFFMSTALCNKILLKKEVVQNKDLLDFILSIKSFLEKFSNVVI